MRDEALAPDEVDVGSTGRVDVVLLRAGGAAAALPVAAVEYVAELTKLTPIPHAPAVVAGLTALRGEVLPVFFLRPLLGLELTALPERARIVLVACEDDRLALAVDAVSGPVPLTLDDLRLPATTTPDGQATLIQGIDPSGVSLLNPDALLADERLFVDVALPQAEDSMTMRTRR